MAARVQGAFPVGCHKTQAVPGGHQGRPYGGDGSAAEQTAMSNYRTLDERPLTRHGRAMRAPTVPWTRRRAHCQKRAAVSAIFR